MSLEPMTLDDVEAVADLVNAAYRGPSSMQGWTGEGELVDGERTSAPELARLLGDPAVHVLLLRDGAAAERPPLGCVRLDDEGGGRWLLGMLSVPPTRQAQGTGRRLLAEAEGFAAARGARTVAMTVITVRDTLIAWYGRRGYADTGARSPYGYPGARRPLEFAHLEKRLAAAPAAAAAQPAPAG